MQLVRPPYAVRKLFSSLIWRIPTAEKKIYLTFDDGPVPEVTPRVLDILKKHNAKATFFCIGQNVEKNTGLYKQITDEGHSVGNHTYNHLNGWKTRDSEYFSNIEKCSALVLSNLFRPPYGKITRTQIKKIIYSNPRPSSLVSFPSSIIMWDVLSYDFDRSVSPEKCLSNVMRYSREGSVIVFHDSLKAQRNLEYTLPKAIEQLSLKGYSFEALK